MGWGLQIGAELTEVLLILSSDSAVDAFKSRAQVIDVLMLNLRRILNLLPLDIFKIWAH
jgi:Las17-binding protein actin regulator